MPVPHTTPESVLIRKAVVPAAGFGSRLRPLTQAFPKELLPIGRKPVLSYVVEELRQSGVREILFVVSDAKPQIRGFFGDSVEETAEGLPPVKFSYTFQEQQRGSGDAVLCAEDWVGGEPFVVAFGDCIVDSPEASPTPLSRMISTFNSNKAGGVILVERVPKEKVFRYGVVDPKAPLEENPITPFELRGVVEKPAIEDAPSDMVIAARFVLHPAIFRALHNTTPDRRGEYNLPDAMCALQEEARSLFAVPLLAGEARRDIGNFETYFTNFVRFALRDAEYGESLRQFLVHEMAKAD